MELFKILLIQEVSGDTPYVRIVIYSYYVIFFLTANLRAIMI